MKLKINMVKVDGMNNFDMWRCEVIDALNGQNLEDTLLLQEKLAETSEKGWDKMNQMTYDVIWSCLTEDIKYHMMTETSAMKIWEILDRASI